MSAPNHFDTVQATWNHQPPIPGHHESIGEFTERCVIALHQRDPRWGHLRKHPGQTQYNGHAANAVLYLSDTPGQSTAVDIVRHGDPTITGPRWLPDTPRYSREDWRDPQMQPAPPLPTPPPNPPPDALAQLAECYRILRRFEQHFFGGRE